MEYLFPLPRFQAVCVPRSEMRLSQSLVFVSIQPLCVFWLEHLNHLHLRQLSIFVFLLPFSFLKHLKIYFWLHQVFVLANGIFILK